MRNLGSCMTIIVLLVASFIGFEFWRFSNPAKVRLRQTIILDTPNGPIRASSIVELTEQGAIPYLPGGENGSHKTAGANPIFQIGSDRIQFATEPFSLIRYAVQYGETNPTIKWTDVDSGLQYKESITIYSKINRQKTRLYLEISKFPLPVWKDIKDNFRFTVIGEPQRSIDERDTLLPGLSLTEFTQRFGASLRAVEFTLTDAPLQ
jgi:hypothetical protein